MYADTGQASVIMKAEEGPRMGRSVELTAAYWTISGTFPGVEPEYSAFDFEDRVRAAATAGFTGMGFWHADLEHVLERRTLKEMKQVLDDNGIKNVEVEFLTDWFLDDESKKQSDVRKKMLMRAAKHLGARQLKVGDFYNRECSMPYLIDSFAALCAEAHEHGTKVAFEPMSVSMINTLADSLRMVEGTKNGGVLIDLWHVVNLRIPFEEIRQFPAQYLFGAELCDGTSAKSASNQRVPIVNRRFCGDGEFDIKGFIEAVETAGYEGPWGTEVFSTDLLDKPLDHLTMQAFQSTAQQFA